MKLFTKDHVEKILTHRTCIDLMRNALMRVSDHSSCQYLRTVVPLPEDKILGLMPAYYDRRYFGTKVITVFYKNLGTAYPSHQGTVLLFESQNGSLLAMADGNSITEIRTGAVSAVATHILAKKDAKTAAFIGCGAQARSHLEALRLVRDIRTVFVYDREPSYAERFAQWAEEKTGCKVVVCKTPGEAVSAAEIITTVTTSKNPLFDYNDVRPGTHINAVGACAPSDRELGSELVARAKFFGDSRESVMKESGDFLIPLQEGRIREDHFAGEIGEVLLGTVSGRTDDEEITVFEALGLAVEDVASLVYIYEQDR